MKDEGLDGETRPVPFFAPGHGIHTLFVVKPLGKRGIALVSTLEPCVMCLGAAMEVGVTRVLFGLNAPADNGTQQVKPPESPKSGGWKVRRAQSRPSS